MTPWLFIREWLDQPAAIGAICPSSQRLAKQMAQNVPRMGTGWVVELGAGTGAVTQALLDYGIDASRLLVIERSSVFVQHLRKRFPHIRVLQGDAMQLDALVSAERPIDAIVSSLPLCSLPKNDAAAIITQWLRALKPGSTLVQYTYHPRGMQRQQLHGFLLNASALIWTNLPPAWVISFQRH